MALPDRAACLAALFALALACGKEGDGSVTESAGSTDATGTTDATGSTDATGTTDATGSTDATGTTGSTDATGTTDATGSTTAGTATSTGTETSGSGTTGVDVSGFERFLLSTAAGPCPPNADCDGFVELLAGGTLRVERFGDTPADIVVAQISPEDYEVAVVVFADPALVALLDSPQPLCDPPTDIFESMLVEIDGAPHEATTTACDQAPLTAARAQAAALRDEYAP